MIRCLSFLLAVLCLQLFPVPSYADVFQKYAKIIWIDQESQVGAAYGHGRKLVEFPIMTGDDETPTPPGTYVVKKKDANYYSRKYKVPMPYSLFFDLKGMRAVHEGDVPDPEEKGEWATHGCIHVEEPYMKWLFNWAEQGRTVVVVKGRRVWEEERPEGIESGAGTGSEEGKESIEPTPEPAPEPESAPESESESESESEPEN
ncbi:MAG: L,D-transpeptidase [Desulfobaccales bacterium]